MMRRRRVGLAVATIFTGSAAGAADASTVSLGPIVRIADGAILACGITMAAEIDGTRLSASLRLEKAADGPIFVLEGSWRDERGRPRSLSGITIETGAETTRKLLPPARPSQEGVKASGPIPGLPGSELMRSLLVSGGTLKVMSPASGTTAIAIPGPAPQQVRASYLNCAGDLERPGG